MNKVLKWFLIVAGALVVIAVGGYQLLLHNTKKHSPFETMKYSEAGKQITVNYCRPYKRGREIFGGLIPYGKVWRTGANEPTTFVTDAGLLIGDKPLPAGEYTLWTIPGKNEWEVIFNGKQYPWGVTMNAEASREAEYDVLNLKAPVQLLEDTTSQFTIGIERNEAIILSFEWDRVRVELPMQWGE